MSNSPWDNDPWDLPNFPVLTPVSPDPSLPPSWGDTYKNCDKSGNLGQQAVDRGTAETQVQTGWRKTRQTGTQRFVSVPNISVPFNSSRHAR